MREGYMGSFDVIAEALNLYEFDRADAKCMGLLSRVNRAVKARKINFFYLSNGVRYFNVASFKKWAKPYIQDFSTLEEKETAKLNNLVKANEIALKRHGLENTESLISEAMELRSDRKSRRRGADKANARANESRKYCIEAAKEIWSGVEDDDVYRIGYVCNLLFDDLKNQKKWCQSKSDKIKEWIKEAGKNGEIHIPSAASMPGRPKKTN